MIGIWYCNAVNFTTASECMLRLLDYCRLC